MDVEKNILTDQNISWGVINVRYEKIPKSYYRDLVSLVNYDNEKIVDILVYLLKETYSNSENAVKDSELRKRVKFLEYENAQLKEQVAVLKRAESYASRRYRIEKGENKIAEKEIDLKKVLNLWEYGLSVSEISKELGITRPTVYKQLDKLVEMGNLEENYKELRKIEKKQQSKKGK